MCGVSAPVGIGVVATESKSEPYFWWDLDFKKETIFRDRDKVVCGIYFYYICEWLRYGCNSESLPPLEE